MKYILLIISIVLLSTCGMLKHYDLMQCTETQDLTCEVMKVFSTEDLCQKFADKLNRDSNMYLYYCDERGVFDK
jgi:hypothetical protein